MSYAQKAFEAYQEEGDKGLREAILKAKRDETAPPQPEGVTLPQPIKDTIGEITRDF